MVDFTYPGIYTQELSRVAPIQGVSTSNFGVVGMAEKGPEDEATLITSFAQFQETFGDFISDSQLAMQLYAFFANDGRQAYVVRVCRSDALAACGWIMNDVSDEVPKDDIVAATLLVQSVGAGGADADLVNTDIVPGTVSFEWQEETALAAGATQYTGGAAIETQVAFRIVDAAGNPVFPIGRPAAAVVGAFSWTDSLAGAQTADIKAPASAAADILEIIDPAAPSPTVGYIDCATGWAVIDMSLYVAPTDLGIAQAITNGAGINYGTTRTVTDDGAGNLIGDIDPAGTNDIDYDGTGAYATAGAFQFAFGDGAVPATILTGSRVVVSYSQQDFRMCASSRGAWGNDVEVRIYGSDEYYDVDTGQYSRVDAEVWYDDPIEGALIQKEIFTELVLDDPTDSNYIVSVLNDTFKGSDLLTFYAAQAEDEITSGINARLRNGLPGAVGEALAGGDGATTQFEGADALYTQDPIIPRTLEITYYDAAGTAYTITDDGDGNLEGDVAPAGVNTVDYDTGELQFTTSAVPTQPVPATPLYGFIRATYYTDPTCTDYCTDTLSGGTDGVAALTRSEVSAPTLEATNRGVYALNVPDEMMAVSIPDFADDSTVTLDLLAWAARQLDKFIVAAVPYGATPTQAKQYKQITLASYSSYGALYYPWVGIIDPKTNLETFLPPMGWAAGAYARTDNDATVSRAPSGVGFGDLNLAVSLERKLSLDEIGVLNKAGVNCLYESVETGRVIWGARTLSRDDFLYIQRRRFFMFVEKSVYKSTWSFVFETISTGLFERIRTLVDGFLEGLLSLGYFPTGVPSLAYLVVCDESNNPASLTDQGIVVCDIWLAPSTPGEFILFRFQQLVVAGAA